MALKSTRTGVGGTTTPYASGINMGARALGRAVGSPAVTGRLVAIGDVASPALLAVFVFTTVYNATTLVQCGLGVLD
jgi:hypothetical protein